MSYVRRLSSGRLSELFILNAALWSCGPDYMRTDGVPLPYEGIVARPFVSPDMCDGVSVLHTGMTQYYPLRLHDIVRDGNGVYSAYFDCKASEQPNDFIRVRYDNDGLREERTRLNGYLYSLSLQQSSIPTWNRDQLSVAGLFIDVAEHLGIATVPPYLVRSVYDKPSKFHFMMETIGFTAPVLPSS